MSISSYGAIRRNGVRFANFSVGKRGHQTLLLRLSILLRNALATCGPLITPGKYWRNITWPEFQPSLPRGQVEGGWFSMKLWRVSTRRGCLPREMARPTARNGAFLGSSPDAYEIR